MKEQTIRGYAKISEIPLKQLLEDLRQSGITCEADDIIDKYMRQILMELYRQRREAKRLESLSEIEAKAWEEAKAIEESERKNRESEALAYVEAKALEAFSKSSGNLRKIGEIIDLCLELLPEKVKSSLSKAIKNKPFSVFVVDSCYEFFKAYHFAIKDIELYMQDQKLRGKIHYDGDLIRVSLGFNKTNIGLSNLLNNINKKLSQIGL